MKHNAKRLHTHPLAPGWGHAVSIIILSVLMVLPACQAGLPGTPTATVTPEPDDTLIGQALKGSRPEVYRLMEDGRLRHISDWTTYLALGYTTESMQQVSDETLAGYELAPPLTPWLTGDINSDLYWLKDGQRHRIPNIETLAAMNGHPQDVALVPEAFLARFPEAEPLPETTSGNDLGKPPHPTAAAWFGDFLWIADESGLLVRWDVQTGTRKDYHLPNTAVIETIVADEQVLHFGTDDGGPWQLSLEGEPQPQVSSQNDWISALILSGDTLWYADVNHFRDRAGYQTGRGLIQRVPGNETYFNLTDDGTAAHDPLKNVTTLAFDPAANILWAGTSFAGVLRYNVSADVWQTFNTFNSALPSNSIAGLALDADGSPWVAVQDGVAQYKHGTWETTALAEGLTAAGALALAPGAGGTLWVAGDHYVAHGQAGQPWQVYTALDHPLMADQFRCALTDATGPWFIGHELRLHFDGQTWMAYNRDMQRLAEFTPDQMRDDGAAAAPLAFPDPLQEYERWLRTWPRPEQDNGRGMHFSLAHWFDELETQKHIERMERLGVRWTLVNYPDRYQLVRGAPMFKKAGMMVIWRPFVRPYESYDYWAADVAFIQAQGIPPYIQVYNEPGLEQEWDSIHDIDQQVFLSNLLPAIREVYDAGGYVGLQFLDPDWLRITLRAMKTEGLTDVFDRLFFVPHPYGLNHPPEYDEDLNSALGFRTFAQVFEEEIGFVPMMVAGEGGWRPGEAQDKRYPPVDEALHRDYHVAVFDWFRTGELSNGEPLPDYLFAFCPWLISDPSDPAAWFDSASGDRTLTIEAVEAMPNFERQFSWDQ